MRLTSLVFAALAFVTLAVAPAVAQDPLAVGKDKCTLVRDDDSARVYELRLRPGERLPMHFAPARVVDALQDCTIVATPAGGMEAMMAFAAGRSYWFDPVVQEVVNIGTTDCRLVVTELKGR